MKKGDVFEYSIGKKIKVIIGVNWIELIKFCGGWLMVIVGCVN